MIACARSDLHEQPVDIDPAELRREEQRAARVVAVVMDGNGRWARQRFMPRFFGHKQGVDVLVRTVNAFAARGVEFLTVFAFSSENWKRPSEEVSGLMSLVLVAVSKYLTKLAGDGGILDDPEPKARLRGTSGLGIEYKVKYWIDCTQVGPGKARHRVLSAVLAALSRERIALARAQDVHYNAPAVDLLSAPIQPRPLPERPRRRVRRPRLRASRRRTAPTAV